MTLVVLAHVLSFSFDMRVSFVSELFVTFRMPMFFFISGYIAYRSIDAWTREYLARMLKKKLVVQIIPATVFMLAFILFLGEKIVPFMAANGFGGYWFTYTLLVMFIFYYVISLIARAADSSRLQDVLLIALAIVGVGFFVWLVPKENSTLKGFSVLNLCNYFQYFVFGLLARKYQSGFHRALSGTWLPVVAIVTFVACLYLLFSPSIAERLPKLAQVPLRHELVRYSGLLIVYAFFFKHAGFFDRDTAFTRSMLFIGRRTLDIYLIHFFLVPDLRGLTPYLAPEGGNMFVIQLVVAFALALLIVGVCLLISEAIRWSDFLGHYLLGAKREGAK